MRDGQDVSTSELLKLIGQAKGKTPRLFWLPAILIEQAATLIGKESIYRRLWGSMQVDDSVTRSRLNWSPPHSVEGSLAMCFGGEHH